MRQYANWATLEKMASISAVIIAVVSLYLAMQETRTQQMMLDAATLPYLQLYNNNFDEDRDQQNINFSIENSGTGSGLVEWVQMSWNGVPVKGLDQRAILAACCSEELAKTPIIDSMSSAVEGRMISANDSVRFISMPRPTVQSLAASIRSSSQGQDYQQINIYDYDALWNAYDQARGNFEISACYCSVLNRCWISRMGEARAETVRSCKREDD